MQQINQVGLSYAPYASAGTEDGQIVLSQHRSKKLYLYDFTAQEMSTISTDYYVKDIAYYGGVIYTTIHDTENGPVFVHTKKGNVLDIIMVGYKRTGALAVTEKYIFVTSVHENRVYRVDRNKKWEKAIIISGADGLRRPKFVASNGNIVAVSCPGIHKIFISDINGNLVSVYGGEGSNTGQLQNPLGLAIDYFERIFISDYGNRRVSIISSIGRWRGNLPIEAGRPHALALAPSGQLIVPCDSKYVFMYRYSYSLWRYITNTNKLSL